MRGGCAVWVGDFAGRRLRRSCGCQPAAFARSAVPAGSWRCGGDGAAGRHASTGRTAAALAGRCRSRWRHRRAAHERPTRAAAGASSAACVASQQPACPASSAAHAAALALAPSARRPVGPTAALSALRLLPDWPAHATCVSRRRRHLPPFPPCRQLVRQGHRPQDHRHWSHAPPEDGAAPLPQRLPRG